MKRAYPFLRWALVLALVIGPSFIRNEGSDAVTFVCTRDGDTAGLCFGEPTLYQRVARRVGVQTEWNPRDRDDDLMLIAPLEELGVATLEEDDGAIRIYSNTDCWTRRTLPHSFCQGKSFDRWRLPSVHGSVGDERTIALARTLTVQRWNHFLHDERERTFVHRRPLAFAAWHLLFLVAAVALAGWNLRRFARAKTAAWLRAVDAIPETPPMTPYRG